MQGIQENPQTERKHGLVFRVQTRMTDFIRTGKKGTFHFPHPDCLQQDQPASPRQEKRVQKLLRNVSTAHKRRLKVLQTADLQFPLTGKNEERSQLQNREGVKQADQPSDRETRISHLMTREGVHKSLRDRA